MKSSRFIILSVLLAISFEVFAAPAPQRNARKRKVERYDTGSFWNVGVGFGMSDLNYSLEGGKTTPLLPSLNFSVEYTYYFKKFFGLGVGLSFSNYGTNAKLTEPMQKQFNNKEIFGYSNNYLNNLPPREIDGKMVNATDVVYRLDLDNWREWQNVYMAEIPVALHFKYKPKKTGFFATLGAKVAFPMASQYVRRKGASISNTGYYPYFDLTLKDVPGRFETETFSSKKTGSISNLNLVNFIGYTEIGMLFQLSKKVDFTLSAYFNMFINELYKSTDKELGFATTANHGSNLQMSEYNGLFGTNVVGNARPYNVGLKLGVGIYQGMTEKQKKAKVKKFMKQYKAYMPKPDTVFVHTVSRDTIFIHDTLVHQSVKSQIFHDTIFVQNGLQTKQEVKLDQILQTSVIWFNFDEYIPILEPSYILDSVADMLLEYPDLEISINGHACKIGTDSYNKKLAMKRAQAVANMLKKLGVPQEQMHVNSYGANHPFRYQGEHQLEKDRRVEIIPFQKTKE